MNRRTMLNYVSASMAATALPSVTHASKAKSTGGHTSYHAPRAPYVERTDGTMLFYRDWGTGKPIVFIAAAGTPSNMWSYQMLPLTQNGFRCIAFDRRGHGRSSDPGKGYDFDSLADDIAAVLESLDLRDVVLVGHSMGCSEITRYITRHGAARIDRIAFIAPTTPFLLKTTDNPHGIDGSIFQKLRTEWLLDYPNWLAANARPFVEPQTSEAQIHWMIDMMLPTSLQAVIECNISLTETDFREELKRMEKTVLIVHGTADQSAPIDLTARPTAKLLPHSQLRVYEQAPHGLFLTHTGRLNADLLRFVQT